ncbi:hypothetical protein [Chitinophaga niabensis]|uniref:Uncharacterized protein n=1 Tax=Chitinophaga niabensis TaxID=536979 RepID=A0A1N6E797_9BACT|nr:hypothetical protein [Chitinophaga niabensis]SIN78890.1 hypothetical protein SAMN04488055_1359 [Chitinophaga niabensis]
MTELPKKQTPHSGRNWKEYLGEAILIVFSVVLALFLTEEINNRKERQQTNEIIKNIQEEVTRNKKAAEEQYHYHLQVLRNIDSALKTPAFLQQIVTNGEFHLNLIADQGVLYRYLNKPAWEVAKSHDILSKIDFSTAALLTRIYDEQDRIMKVEDEIAQVIFDRESRKPTNTRETLLLIRDNYRGWAVDRVPVLLRSYEEAVKDLARY